MLAEILFLQTVQNLIVQKYLIQNIPGILIEAKGIHRWLK